MIDPKDFIRGERFPSLCDVRLGRILYPNRQNLSVEENNPKLDTLLPEKKHVSMYTRTEYIPTAMNIIRDNPDKQFTLVTHNSDLVVESHVLPPNLYEWFAMNKNTTQDKIHSIPIGLENEHWFPYKQSVMLEKKAKLADVIKCFAQFNTGTHPERLHALNNLDTNTYDLYMGSNGYRDQHILFCNNLLKYAFCLCPRGNGIDTHRLWEALYMGCIPICKDYPAHQFDEPLPILFVQDWNEITTELLEQTYKNIDRSLFNSNLLKISYWSKRINDM